MVERRLAKANVAGSNPVSRSISRLVSSRIREESALFKALSFLVLRTVKLFVWRIGLI